MNKVYLIHPKKGSYFVGCLVIAAISAKEADIIREKYEKDYQYHVELEKAVEDHCLNGVYSFNSGILINEIKFDY